MGVVTALKKAIPEPDHEEPSGLGSEISGSQTTGSELGADERLSQFWNNLSRGQKNWENLCQEFKLWGAARPDSVERAFFTYLFARNYLLERFDLAGLSDAFVQRAKQLIGQMEPDDTPAEVADRMRGLSYAAKPLIAEVLARTAILSELHARYHQS